MILTFGEILLRLSTPNAQKINQTTSFDAIYGGAESNVAIALSYLGHEVGHFCKLPENELGKAAIATLRKHGVDTSKIISEGERMGIYFLETGAGLRTSHIIYDRQSSAMANIDPDSIDWQALLKNVTWLHWSGITPALSQNTADLTLKALKVASDLNIPISVDLNYRSKLWKYGKNPAEIMLPLLEYCDYIMGGIDAPEKMFGIVPEDKGSSRGEMLETDLISVGEQLLKKFKKAKLFATTLRWIKSNNHHQIQGVLYTRQNKELYMSSVYDMPSIIDRIGGGDAFMAGLIHGLNTYTDDYQSTVNFAIASAALKHYIHGDASTSTSYEIENLITGKTSFLDR